jgi:hypothetical protein
VFFERFEKRRQSLLWNSKHSRMKNWLILVPEIKTEKLHMETVMPRCWLGGSGVMVASRPAVGHRPDRAGRAAACRVDRGGHSVASRYSK